MTYSREIATELAPELSLHLRKKVQNKAKYDYNRAAVRAFQSATGLPEDGHYGGETRGALLYFAPSSRPPKAFFKPTDTIPYDPPEPAAIRAAPAYELPAAKPRPAPPDPVFGGNKPKPVPVPVEVVVATPPVFVPSAPQAPTPDIVSFEPVELPVPAELPSRDPMPPAPISEEIKKWETPEYAYQTYAREPSTQPWAAGAMPSARVSNIALLTMAAGALALWWLREKK